MPRIRRIAIKNFRSIHSLDVNVEDLTAFVGDNDCGKSNILRALNLFFNGQTNPGETFNFRNDFNRYATPREKRARQIEVELDLELPDAYRANNGQFIRWKKLWRTDGLLNDRDYNGFNLVRKRGGGRPKVVLLSEGISDRSNAHALLRKIEFEYVPAIRSVEFFRNLRGRIYNVISEVAEQGMRDTSGDFEKAISGYVTGLIADISEQLGDQAKISLPNDLSTIFERLDFLYSEHAISLDHRGDGIKGRYIPLILKFIADQKRTLSAQGSASHTFIWAYEEPENNLEFRRAQELAQSFCDLADDDLTQVLMTTHSPIFYNLTRSEGVGRLAVHVSCPDGATGTLASKASEDGFDLDERMGVMPIIAPHIAKAQSDLNDALEQSRDLNEKLVRLNPGKKPTLFIEGPTEYRLYSDLLRKFRPENAEAIFLAEPPARAGANYVANMLRAWEYKNRHLSATERRFAVGIVDLDDEGKGVERRFSQEIQNPKFVKLSTLPVPGHLVGGTEIGLLIPVCLEHLWPVDIWSHAKAQGWLELRSTKEGLSDELTRRLIDDGETLNDIVSDDDQLFLKNWPLDERKSDWMSYILALEDPHLERVASEHLRVLDSACAELMK
ncbi:AAA family ATPase [uncultured Hyphomonas sp.]|uniref:ATP-dependent nuclease n=1 Tax=uncultured Hyphomonas sp. TaxID=225298 RepID=UPI000C6ACA3A|nr:hypothetical protein [Hyphomonadaceae bacterium]MBA29053.1 hypothetical protein [Hyphomonadaceae bacterium]